jgi:flagellar FliJ protein
MAKRFRFSLQKVLDLREHREEQKAIELGKAKAELQKKEQVLNRLKKEKNRQINESKWYQSEQPDLNAIRVAGSYVEQLNTAINQTKQQVNEKNKKVEIRRTELLSAVKDKKIVEMLKKKKIEEYKREVLHQERKNEDELAIRMASRKQQEN